MVVAGVVVGIAAGRPTPPSRRETALDDLQQVPVLERSLHTLLVVQLLVHGVLGLVGALLDAQVDAVPRRQGAQQAHAEREA